MNCPVHKVIGISLLAEKLSAVLFLVNYLF
jgi:hypothetical protein